MIFNQKILWWFAKTYLIATTVCVLIFPPFFNLMELISSYSCRSDFMWLCCFIVPLIVSVLSLPFAVRKVPADAVRDFIRDNASHDLHFIEHYFALIGYCVREIFHHRLEENHYYVCDPLNQHLKSTRSCLAYRGYLRKKNLYKAHSISFHYIPVSIFNNHNHNSEQTKHNYKLQVCTLEQALIVYGALSNKVQETKEACSSNAYRDNGVSLGFGVRFSSRFNAPDHLKSEDCATLSGASMRAFAVAGIKAAPSNNTQIDAFKAAFSENLGFLSLVERLGESNNIQDNSDLKLHSKLSALSSMPYMHCNSCSHCRKCDPAFMQELSFNSIEEQKEYFLSFIKCLLIGYPLSDLEQSTIETSFLRGLSGKVSFKEHAEYLRNVRKVRGIYFSQFLFVCILRVLLHASPKPAHYDVTALLDHKVLKEIGKYLLSEHTVINHEYQNRFFSILSQDRLKLRQKEEYLQQNFNTTSNFKHSENGVGNGSTYSYRDCYQDAYKEAYTYYKARAKRLKQLKEDSLAKAGSASFASGVVTASFSAMESSSLSSSGINLVDQSSNMSTLDNTTDKTVLTSNDVQAEYLEDGIVYQSTVSGDSAEISFSSNIDPFSA